MNRHASSGSAVRRALRNLPCSLGSFQLKRGARAVDKSCIILPQRSFQKQQVLFRLSNPLPLRWPCRSRHDQRRDVADKRPQMIRRDRHVPDSWQPQAGGVTKALGAPSIFQSSAALQSRTRFCVQEKQTDQQRWECFLFGPKAPAQNSQTSHRHSLRMRSPPPDPRPPDDSVCVCVCKRGMKRKTGQNDINS